MALSHVLTAVWFILVGVTWLTWVTISTQFLGGFALVVGIIWLVEGWYPVTLPGRRPVQ